MTDRLVEQQGSSLLEVALALLLISALMGSFFHQLTARTEQKQAQAVTQQLMQIKQSLLAFLKVHGHLPCPDDLANPDGRADRKLSKGVEVCRFEQGRLPYLTLGIEGQDVWQQPFLYRINKRATSATRITGICESASVFARQGTRQTPDVFGQCLATGVTYCRGCSDACVAGCVFGAEADPRVADQPPYFYFSTRPISTDAAELQTLSLFSVQEAKLDDRLVAVVVNFGLQGAEYWAQAGQCPMHWGALAQENCDNDLHFYQGEGVKLSHQIIGVSLNEAKQTQIQMGRFQ